MKIKYANEWVEQLGMVDPTTYVYQFIYDEKYSVGIEVIQYFIMHGLVLCIKVDIYVEHMFYTWLFSHNTAVTISIKNNKYFLSLNTNNNLFAWGARNSNRNWT